MSKRPIEDNGKPTQESDAPLSKVPKTNDDNCLEDKAELNDEEVIESPNNKAEPPKIPHTIAEITEGDNIHDETEHDELHVNEEKDEKSDIPEFSEPLSNEEAVPSHLPNLEHHEEVAPTNDPLVDEHSDDEEVS